MKGFLVDTNVLSELRKGARAHAGVSAWFESAPEDSLFLSVLVVGEIRRGIEALRGRDRASALNLDRWLARLEQVYGSRILPVNQAIAEEWGRIDAAFGLPAIDGLLGATARVHELVLVTRNTKDVLRAGIDLLNPFRP